MVKFESIQYYFKIYYSLMKLNEELFPSFFTQIYLTLETFVAIEEVEQ